MILMGRQRKKMRCSLLGRLVIILVVLAVLVHIFVAVFYSLLTDPQAFSDTSFIGRTHRYLLLGVFLFLSSSFIGAFYFIRRILKPLKWLQDGVNQIGQGDLKVTIPIQRYDEIGQLTEAFNHMTQRIREMIDARDQLLIDVSHELRSPITRMKLALEFIPDSEKKQKIISDIAEMERMIAEILETERLKGGHGKLVLADYDLVSLLNQIGQEYQDQFPGIALKNLPDQCFVSIDVERISIVLRNVIDNAYKYSQSDSNPVELAVSDKGECVSLRIMDDGTGIPDSDIPNLFEPFYRVDRSRSKKTGGYGLGLSLCKKIMDAHHGSISIRNNVNRGITVELILPK